MFVANNYAETAIKLDRVNAFEKDERYAFLKISMSGGEDFLILKYPTAKDRDEDYSRLLTALRNRCL